MLEHCFHSATRASVRSDTDVGWLGLASSRHSNLSQRYSMGLRLGLCAGQSSSSTPILTKHFYMDLALCTGALSCRKRERAFSKLFPQSWKHRIVLHQTLQLAVCILAGSFLLASAKSQIRPSDCQMVKRDSSLQRIRFHCSRVQWWRALQHSSWHLAFLSLGTYLCLYLSNVCCYCHLGTVFNPCRWNEPAFMYCTIYRPTVLDWKTITSSTSIYML